MDSLAPTRPAAAALQRPTPTARRLAAASISPNTRRAYSGALRRLDAGVPNPAELTAPAPVLAERGGAVDGVTVDEGGWS